MSLPLLAQEPLPALPRILQQLDQQFDQQLAEHLGRHLRSGLVSNNLESIDTAQGPLAFLERGRTNNEATCRLPSCSQFIEGSSYRIAIVPTAVSGYQKIG